MTQSFGREWEREARSRAEQYDWSRVLAQIVSYYGEID